MPGYGVVTLLGGYARASKLGGTGWLIGMTLVGVAAFGAGHAW